MQMLEENQANSSLPTPSSTSSPMNPSAHFSDFTARSHDTDLYKVENPTFEESFTIHLGSQLKQMHNIRILSTDVFDLCSTWDKMGPRAEPPPHMLQTALALYSNDLCGLVLMTDNHVDSFSKSLKSNYTELQSCLGKYVFRLQVSRTFAKARPSSISLTSRTSWRRFVSRTSVGRPVRRNRPGRCCKPETCL